MEEIRLGNINKKGSLKNELLKRGIRGVATELLGVISLSIKGESLFLSSFSL